METRYIKSIQDIRAMAQYVVTQMKNAGEKLVRIRIDFYDEKTREQEKRYHAMLGDISKQAQHLNQVLDVDSWKRLCVKQFADDCIANDIDRLADYWRKNGFRLMPSIDGKSLVTLGKQTREFPKYVAAGFIEWLYHFGSENKIVWSDPKYQEEYERFVA